MNIQDICPYCEQVTDIKKIQRNEDIKVRNESITVRTEFFECQKCNQEFDDPKSKNDPLELAYRDYRSRHGMFQPEEIRDLRKSYDLTQKELSELLSWGEVTLSRYEKGKLQDKAHDKMLQLLKNPINVLNLINKNETIFTNEKKIEIIKKLTQLIQSEDGFEGVYQPIFGSYDSTIYSGHQKLNIKKVHSMIGFYCYPEGQFQTKLCKLLFYADSLHFYKHNKSISGLQYVKMPFGPVPNNYERYKTFLIENEKLEIEEILFGDDIVGEKLTSVTGPSLSLFSKDEQQTLNEIKQFFTRHSSKQISEFSHHEDGYVQTPDRKLISYEYAKNLKIAKLVNSFKK